LRVSTVRRRRIRKAACLHFREQNTASLRLARKRR
jgi:hypothetical protein